MVKRANLTMMYNHGSRLYREAGLFSTIEKVLKSTSIIITYKIIRVEFKYFKNTRRIFSSIFPDKLKFCFAPITNYFTNNRKDFFKYQNKKETLIMNTNMFFNHREFFFFRYYVSSAG